MNVLKTSYEYLNKYIHREINYYRTIPTNVLLFLTYRCTSKCKSCTMWQRKTNQSELTLDDWKKLADMLREYNIVNVEMFGGDALLRKDVLVPLSDYIKKKNKSEVDLTTNCNLMDEELALQLITIGMNVIYISVDGIGDIHDDVRGSLGSFARIKKTIEYITKIKAKLNLINPKIVVNCTISALNYNIVDQILNFANDTGANTIAFEYVGQFPKEMLSVSAINSIEPQPYYLAGEKSIFLNRQQAIELKQKLRTMRAKSGKMKVYMNSRNVDVLSIEELTTGIFPVKKCYICRYLIIVDPYGNVIPCPFYNNYILGNVKDKHLKAIWNNEKHKQFIKFIDAGKSAICKHCILTIQRNLTLLQSFRKHYFGFAKIALDEHPYITGEPAAMSKKA